MTNLIHKKCVPLTDDIPPMTEVEIEETRTQVPDWEVVKVEGIPHLKRSFKFDNFIQGLEFTNKLVDLAETEGHHPLIELTWGRVRVEWWTHDIGGLHLNDFIMAAKTNQVYKE